MRIAVATALGCLVLALPACGGEDDETTTTTTVSAEEGASGATGPEPEGETVPDEEAGKPVAAGDSDSVEVTEAVVAVVGGGDAEATCVTSATVAYVRSAYGDEQGCRAAVQQQGSFEVDVAGVRVDADGGTAETTAVPAAGPNKGEDLTVRLIEEDGTWKVDFLRSDAPAGP